MAQVLKTLRAYHRPTLQSRPTCARTVANVAASSTSRGLPSSNAPPVEITSNGSLSSRVYNLRDETCEWFEIPAGHSESHRNIYEPTDFFLYPRFLSGPEQDLILDHSLLRLDKMERPRARKRGGAQDQGGAKEGTSRFRDEVDYSFEAGHFDQVISSYREMQVGQFLSGPAVSSTTTDTSQTKSLEHILARLQALLPESTRPPLIHLLHLASNGKIDAHVDNVEASGSTIVGLSLGSTRVMRLGHQSAPIDSHLKVLLPPGSVYVQRDSVRYHLQHSIPAHDSFKNQQVYGAQRLSVMLRDGRM
ncbi:hypothetical protein PTTG_04035 [Puccinia triticina 1-1 BBBD Race 1]|uniref:2OG-FeII_Oxy_2 domain-containing protein n=2 Tax=Puccinia triticina TaxID=208348 RepID=A0A0C4ETA6_PUCT1|nr:uncharacterized protein PtA15_7A170 [Puccinia triticina]OAV96390.1 hypothetical protein PTTG_04035 [Puccinia triticina 1-1 BBBD Race 1]WAQ86444.1 hypothetical protein PtA15_7A170 [Puccinia triticina]